MLQNGSARCSLKRVALFLSSLLLLLGASIALGGGTNRPQITELRFPTDLPIASGATGRLRFQDPDGDVTTALLAVVDGRFYNASLEIPQGEKAGLVTFSIACTTFAQQVTLQARLYDRAGNASEPRLFSFTCGKPQQYNYDREQATPRPIATRAILNFFIVKDGVTTLAEGARFQSGSPLGEPDPLVRRAIAEALIPGLEGIWDQCGLGFELGLVKVLDPERLQLSGWALAARLFTSQGRERVIHAQAETSGLLGQTLQALASLVQGQPGASLSSRLNVFIVGVRVLAEWQGELRDVEGFSGTDGIEYALVRWGAVSFDESSQTLLRPKQVTATLAHELGHLLGLKHPDQDGLPGTEEDQFNLMWGSGVTPSPRAGLLPAQCQVALANLTRASPSSSSPSSPQGQGPRPRVEFERPKEGATLSREVALSVRGEGFQDLERTGLARFEFSRDGRYFEPIGTDSDGSDGFSTIWETGSVASGTYLLRAVLVDGRGRSASAELRVKVAN
ncbi:MAG: hypothetical protein ACUVRH_03735 [Candidatus Bipolaricaulia bacterium]